MCVRVVLCGSKVWGFTLMQGGVFPATRDHVTYIDEKGNRITGYMCVSEVSTFIRSGTCCLISHSYVNTPIPLVM